MSRHLVGRMARGGRARSVALVAAVCALAAAGGYTGALWAGGDELDAVRIETGHLDVRILKGDERVVDAQESFMLTDRDRDGVTWFVGSMPSGPGGEDAGPVWTLVDTRVPLVYPGETWVAAIPFTVGLEGHNLLADLSLEGGRVADALGVGEAGFMVADGVVGPGQVASFDDVDSVGLDESFEVELPARTQADDGAQFTVLLMFQVPGDGAGSVEVRGRGLAIKDLSIVLQQNRSVEGGR